MLNERSTVKDLEDQAKNTKHLMDKLNRAFYGMTFQEALEWGAAKAKEGAEQHRLIGTEKKAGPGE